MWRGRGGSSSGTLVAASGWAAARWFRRALARAPRRRRRRAGVEGVEGESVGGVAVTRLTLVLPPTVEKDRVACPPAFSILWKAQQDS